MGGSIMISSSDKRTLQSTSDGSIEILSSGKNWHKKSASALISRWTSIWGGGYARKRKIYFLPHFLYEEDILEEKHSVDNNNIIITTKNFTLLSNGLTNAPKDCQTVWQSYYIRIAVLLGFFHVLFVKYSIIVIEKFWHF